VHTLVALIGRDNIEDQVFESVCGLVHEVCERDGGAFDGVGWQVLEGVRGRGGIGAERLLRGMEGVRDAGVREEARRMLLMF